MSDTATMAQEPEAPAGYAFEQLEPSPPLPRDAPDRILALATAQAEHIHERARAEGHAEGRAQGHRDGIAETTAAASALAQALRELQRMRTETAEAVERDAVELALALAAKILAGAFEAQPERVLDVVHGALRRISDRRQIVVMVDPADLEVVSAAVHDLQIAGGWDRAVRRAGRPPRGSRRRDRAHRRGRDRRDGEDPTGERSRTAARANAR